MKKKTINKLTLFTALGLGVIILASCTANFASPKDKANILYAYDVGTLVIRDPEGEEQGYTFGSGDHQITLYQNYSEDTNDVKVDFNGNPQTGLTTILSVAKNNGLTIPQQQFWADLDCATFKAAWPVYVNNFDSMASDEAKAKNKESGWEINSNIEKTPMCEVYYKDCMNKFGYLKFNDGSVDAKSETEETRWENWDKTVRDLKSNKDPDYGPDIDFTTYYKSQMESKINNVRTAIAIYDGEYGNFGYGNRKIKIEAKSWGYAWKKGFIEGLLVFPVAWLVETFCHNFGLSTGWGQFGAIMLVTFIVRTLLLLVSLKSTIAQQRMTMLQPELAKIQAKYPNANTNQAQKQRMSQEQMALYKKNKINPFGTLIVLIVQFPLFIGVWGAMQGSASLATGKWLSLHLSDSIWTTLTTQSPGNFMNNGWLTAFFLVILMSVMQFLSMKLPQWLQKAREKKMPKLTANPAMSSTQKQMKWFGYIMLAMIIIMGFTLPAGMGLYWLAGALFSIAQTFVMQAFMYDTAVKRWFIKLGHSIKGLFKKKEKVN